MPFEDVAGLLDVSALAGAFSYIALTWLLGRGLRSLTDRIATAVPNHRLVVEQTSALIRFLLYIGGIALALRSMFSFSDDVLKVIGGTVVVTIGLVLKDQASSVLAGILILVERPFQVGDRVSFAGYYGTITSVGLRAVRLVTLDDNEVTIPNSKLLSDPVASGNSGALDMLVQQDFYVGTDQDFGRAKRIVRECLTTSRYFYPDKGWAVLVNQVTLNDLVAVRIRAKAYVNELKYEKAFESDVAERVLAAFAAEGILPPAVLHRALPEVARAGPRQVA